MKKVVKINLMSLFALTFTLVFMSFKLIDDDPMVLEWHEITLNDAINPSNDQVGGSIASPDELDDCETYAATERCAIQLNMPESYDPSGKTIATILSELGQTSVKQEAFRQE